VSGIGRRLLVVATIEVAVILGALVVALAIFAFSSYIGSVRSDLAATYVEVQDELRGDDVARTAESAGRFVANRYLRSDVEVIIFDAGRRVAVFRRLRPDTPPVVATTRRGDLSGDPRVHGPLALPTIGLATAFGLQPVRGHVGRVDVVVRENDAVLTSAVDRFALPLVVALLFAIIVSFGFSRSKCSGPWST